MEALQEDRGVCLLTPGRKQQFLAWMRQSAEEAVAAARWHCLLQREAEAPSARETPQEPSLGAERGMSSLGPAGPFQEQKRTKDPCPFLIACHIRAGGPVQDPDPGPGMGGFVPYQPSGERPGEAAHPLLMGVFPPADAGQRWPGAHGGSCTTALHLSQREPLLQHLRVLPHPLCHSSEEPSGHSAPYNWLDPEILSHWPGVSEPADLWSHGLGLNRKDAHRQGGVWAVVQVSEKRHRHICSLCSSFCFGAQFCTGLLLLIALV